MTTDELYNLTLEKLHVKEIHPLHKAIMEECCENAILNQQNETCTDTLIFAVHVSFMTTLSALKGTLVGLLKLDDQVTINYREQTFTISKNSNLLKYLCR